MVFYMSKLGLLLPPLIALIAASAAHAQLLGGPLGGVTRPVTGVIGQFGNKVGDTVEGVAGVPIGPREQGRIISPSLDRVVTPLALVEASASQLAELRRLRLDALVRANRAVLARDTDGQPVRKGELIVTDPDPAALSLAIRSGFRLLGDETAGELGMRLVTLAVPGGMDVNEALKRLRKVAPRLEADYNHVYEPAGGSLLPAAGTRLAAAPRLDQNIRIAMIDGGVATHPSLARASIEQRGFAGPAQPTGHGTAIASLLVGEEGAFSGAARGVQLFVGDVYGGNPAAGSATSIIRALGWAASKRPAVINISLVGPQNRALARAVAALRAKSIPLVAAVGNDGPAAPPQYPASYEGVIAVTGVDARDRALVEAGRAKHLDFAAPGADMAAALPGEGYTRVRGTSFAAPFVSARLAVARTPAKLAREAVPGKGRVGRGIICGYCRVAPGQVGLR